MAIQVKNLVLDLQTGTDNTYYASWDAPTTTVTTTTTSSGSGSIRKGGLVSIKSGATYYNGVAIPDWVMSQKWYILEISGTRAVINKNESGTNAIMSPIHVNNLIGGSTSSGSSSSTTTTTTVSNLDNYKVVWKYTTGDGIWFNGSSTTVGSEDSRNSTYSPPENATNIGVWVTPVSKTYTSNSTTKSYWTGTAVSKSLSISNTKPTTPEGLSVELEKFTLTAKVENISDFRTDQVEFEVYNGNTKYKTGIVTVLTARAIFTCTVKAGGEYRVRCRAINTTGGKNYSDWSDYTSSTYTIPASVTGVKVEADTKTSVKVTWTAVPTADSYTVEYTNNKAYFDTSNSVSSTTVENSTTAYITGMETGYNWYFRVKAVNEQGDSGWSSIVSAVVGSKPEPPTTWSLSTTAIVGEDVILYWTHNSEDGSKQREAQLYISINGSAEYITVTSSTSEDEDEPVYSYTIDSNDYSDGGKIIWMVKTKGVHDDYSDWSTQRTIDLYAPPTLEIAPTLSDGDILTALPLTFTTVAGPSNQTPISYHVSVSAVGSYETVNNVGNDVTISAGDDIYSKVFVSSESELTHTISAGDITFESGQSYILSVTVSMDSGLTATATYPFSVEWVTQDYICDATIFIDKETLTAHVAPFCLGEGDVLVENVTLSVYRREADGSFTEIGTGLANNMVTTVTDPHPSLDLARYRIVSTDTTTGTMDYSDLPGVPVNEPSIVIQWDEQWTSYDYSEDVAPDVPSWTGSMVRLPYNVDVSEKSDPDVSLIEYIGRSNPVSYYGTQRGEGGSWSTVIDKKDKETIYALRRLKSWQGDVYVREPSGIGYWANIKVSMSIKHLDLTVPVSFEINRVEGGV